MSGDFRGAKLIEMIEIHQVIACICTSRPIRYRPGYNDCI